MPLKIRTINSRTRLAEFDPSVGLDRGAGRLTEVVWYFVKIAFFLTATPWPSRLKSGLLRGFGAQVGRNVVIKPRVNIHFPWKLSIGDDVWIGEEVFILNFEPVRIGSDCVVSQRAFLCGGNHDFRDPSMPYRNGPITLGDGAWVGAQTFVGPGVDIGVDSVVAAGSVVTKSLGSNGLYGGNPVELRGSRWKNSAPSNAASEDR